jgi:hypothetical protein
MQNVSIVKKDPQALGPLLNQLDARHDALRGLLIDARDGADIPAWRLEMARQDVMTVLNILSPPDAGGDADEDL